MQAEVGSTFNNNGIVCQVMCLKDLWLLQTGAL
jgi:hypothetical protein